MTTEALYVWWLDQKAAEDVEVIHSHDPNKVNLPEYLWLEFNSRLRRPGGGRLWVASHLPNGVRAMPMGDPDGVWPEELLRCGGIVFEAQHLQLVKGLPGQVTDLWLRPV